MTGSDLAEAAAAGIGALIICAVAIGVVLAYGLPWLWGVLKPLLHAMTA